MEEPHPLPIQETGVSEEEHHNIYTDPRRRVFNDPIHGHIELHPPCVDIIDTPQFQRLRYIKQLGCVYYVYPGASHNRFEHSLGTCFLAGQLVTALRQRQPSLNIDDKDVLCVEIAALCHDLGHGPFSHVFDKMVIPEILPENKKWKHEYASVDMFQYILAQNEKVRDAFAKKNLTEQDVSFIKELIYRKGEEIVSNDISGVDVDKWDYFARDCYMLGIKNNFDHNRLIKFARVIKVQDGNLQICYRDKDVWNLYDMFYARFTLHIRAYQHRTVRNVELLLKNAVVEARKDLEFQGTDGNVPIADTIDDMAAFMQMTDEIILHKIRNGNSEKARTLLEKIENRELYKFLGQTQLKAGQKFDNTKESRKTIRENVMEKTKQEKTKESEVLVDLDADGSVLRVNDSFGPNLFLSRSDLIFSCLEEKHRNRIVDLNYGKEDQNPINSVYFYTKSAPDVAIRIRKEQVSQMLPDVIEEQYIRLYTNKRDENILIDLRKAFSQWCKDKTFPAPIGM